MKNNNFILYFVRKIDIDKNFKLIFFIIKALLRPLDGRTYLKLLEEYESNLPTFDCKEEPGNIYLAKYAKNDHLKWKRNGTGKWPENKIKKQSIPLIFKRFFIFEGSTLGKLMIYYYNPVTKTANEDSPVIVHYYLVNTK